MNFDTLYQPYPRSRFSVTAPNGMVATSNILASQAGLEILKKGGNAVDAAIATAATLTVVEPCSNGLGSDAYAIVWMKDKMYGLNASGYSSESVSIDKIKALGYDKIPQRGWLPVMIPGAPKAWASLIEKFGNLTLEEVLQPAIFYAENGFTVSPVLAALFEQYVGREYPDYKDKKEHQEWVKTFTKNGEPYRVGEIMKFPDMAKSLRLIGKSNAKEFYEGEIAKAIVNQANRDGGFVTLNDLKEYDVNWVEPLSVNYHGYDIWELPPNGDGIVALIALNILKNFKFDKKDCVDTYHKQFEAIKIAFAEALNFVTDPKDIKIDYKKYLSDEYGKLRAGMISDVANKPEPMELPSSGTVYLCTADKDGNMVSYIQSNFRDFGSGIVIEDYGVSLQNRGFDFSLDPNKANALKPRKKSFHTIIPGFITKDDKAVGPFGLMGGYIQPQGHLQVIMNMLDFNLNPQAALDAPRWQWMKDLNFTVEPEFNKTIVDELIKKGHNIEVKESYSLFGRGQIIMKLDGGGYIGACESRSDSGVACY